MKTSDAGVALIRDCEGCRLAAYRDAVGVWTIGYGDTQEVTPGLTITREEAERRLSARLAEVEAAVAALVRVALTQGQFDALVSFAYNLGAGALARSTLLARLNDGDTAGAAAEFGRWVHAGAEVLPGLVTRRARERALFEGGNHG
jgi:lysozyme